MRTWVWPCVLLVVASPVLWIFACLLLAHVALFSLLEGPRE